MASPAVNVTAAVLQAVTNATNTTKVPTSAPSGNSAATDPITYANIIQVLVPLYLVMALGYWSGRSGRADTFTLDRLNSFNARIALPGLLFRNIATSNLYDADFNIILSDIVYKVVLAGMLAPLCYFIFPKDDKKKMITMGLVAHSVMTLPNYVVIGIPVLSALYTPKNVKGQYCIHLTVLAGVMELVLGERQKRRHREHVGEHAPGALMALPRTVGKNGFAEHVKEDFKRVGTEMRSLMRNVEGRMYNVMHHYEDPDDPNEPREARVVAPGQGGSSGGGDSRGSGMLREAGSSEDDDAEAGVSSQRRSEDDGGDGGGDGELETTAELFSRVLRERVMNNPMVLASAAAVIVSMAVKHKNRNAKLPYIIDAFSLYLNNCVLGVSLFNFGLFAFLNGLVACEPREAALGLLGRFVLSPLINVPVMYFFKMRGELMKIMIMQAALPQAVASFVVFKEFKIRPDIFSTSLILGTVMCLPATCIWFFALDKMVASM